MSSGEKKETEHQPERFGTIAVRKGFITHEQLLKAITEQVDGNIAGRGHKPIGRILFERGWLGLHEIESILQDIYGRKR